MIVVGSSSRKNILLGAYWTVALLVCLACASALLAQLPTGTILGVVKDSSGAVIPGANVTVRNTDTAQTRTLVSEADGSYRAPALPVGNYEIRAEKEGFRTEVQSGLTLTVSQEAVVNFTTEVGSTGQTVSVTAEAPLVDTTKASLGGLVNEQKMADLPLNGRNYIDLSLLQPGVAEFKAVNKTLTGNVGTYFVSNGGTVRSNLYLLDGAILTNILNANSASMSGSTLGVDGIREYQVITNVPGAEYGMVMGSWMTVASKSGSNSFHGDVFEYIRNSSLDAANYFDRAIPANNFRRLPEFQRNNFGASGGGPIIKDKTFFYGVYEGVREHKGLSIIQTVPAAGCHGPAGTVLTNVICPQLQSTPSATVSAQTANILALLPVPNTTNNQFFFPYMQPASDNYGQMRVDHNFSANDNMFGRYTIQDTNVIQTEGYPGFTTPLGSRDQFITLSENHIFSPALLNTGRFSFSRTTQQSANGPQNAIGPGISYVPGFPIGPTAIGGVTGSFGSNLSAPTLRKQNIFTYSDDVFYTKGKHSLKFGALINHYQQRTGNGSYSSGQATFPTLASFITGQPSVFQAVIPGSLPTRYFHFNTIGFYAQDDFRLRSNLTLNLGLRYEFFTVPQEQHDQWSHLDNPQTSAAVTVSPETNNNSSLRNWSPRIGFAWDVKGDGKTAVRGGFALLYDIGQISGSMAFQTLTAQPPFTINYILSNPAAFTTPVVPGSAPGTPTLRLIDYNVRQPHLLQYNLSVERQLPGQVALTLAYVGSRGINLYDSYEANPTIPGGVLSGGACVARPAGQSANLTSMVDGSATACWLGTEPRVNTHFGSMNFFSSAADSYYNALQFSLIKRVSHGVEFQSSYTYSRNIDTISSSTNSENAFAQTSFFEDPFHPILDRGLSPFDVTHVWKFNMIYHLPGYGSAEGLTGKLLSGWWVSTITTLQSGSPFTVGLGSNRSKSQVGGGAAGIDRPDLVAGRSMSSITSGVSSGCGTGTSVIPAGTPLGTVARYFDPCAFTMPTQGVLGNLGRNTLRGPGFEDVDFSLVKDTAVRQLGEAGSVQFRAEIFNILNHPDFGLPNRTAFSGTAAGQTAPLGTAGQITSTVGTSRQIQFALKLLF